MGVAAMHDIPVVAVVLNNAGYMSIRGGQRKFQGRHIGAEFNRDGGNGAPYTAHIADMAKSFGIEAWRVDDPDAVRGTLQKALDAKAPALVEIMISRDAAGPFADGWWDFPSPGYYEKEQAEYAAMRATEQHF
jgi:acetolactate synthase-1/2/3 large subunit